MIIETKNTLPAGLPVVDEDGNVVGVTNLDGSISITDVDFAHKIVNQQLKPLSLSFNMEEK